MSFYIELNNEVEVISISHVKEWVPGKDEIVTWNIKCISDSIVYPLTQVANPPFHKVYSLIITSSCQAKNTLIFNCYRLISLIYVRKYIAVFYVQQAIHIYQQMTNY